MFDAHMVSGGRNAAPPPCTPMRWPPPGLESSQGAAWRALAILAAGTGIMTAPLLLSVATPQSFWSAGLFGASWWVPLAAAVTGLLLVIFAIARFARALLAGVQAVRHGHDWPTVAHVLTDARHDAGFLIQGHRQYSALEEKERRMLLSARVTAASCYALGLLWIACAFAIGVILAGRGIITRSLTLTLVVIGPAALLFAIAVIAHGVESNACRAVTRAWRRDDTRSRRLVDEIGDWRADRATRLIHLPAARRPLTPARTIAFTLIAVATLLPLPVLTLAMASAMGPVLAHVAVPHYESSASRFARAALLTPHALDATGGMTALEAGELLHAIASIGTTAIRSPIEREPVRRFAPFNTASSPATLPPIEAFGTQLLPRARSLTAEEIAWLERITSHAALNEFSRLARAPLVDVTGGRWHRELLASASAFDIPVARFNGMRSAAHHHVARAVLQLNRGQVDDAETTLREVISVGLLISRESPTMVDLLVGNAIAINGAAALQTLYQTVGRTAEAEAMRRQAEGIERAGDFSAALRMDSDLDAGLRRSMTIAANETLPRGLRWESLLSIQIAAGCLNPHTVVFGHGADYTTWLEQTRASLVRYPTEEALFDLTLRGTMLPPELRTRTDFVERILGVTLGRTESVGACAALLTGLSAR